MSIVNTKAITGKKIDKIDNTNAEIVSTNDTIGLVTPPVTPVETNRVVDELPETVVAVPAPAIIANAHVMAGLKSETTESIITTPAKAARGTEMLSSKLSRYGMKYADISTIVATLNIIKAISLPSHSQEVFNSQTSKYDAKLKTNKGKNTLNPTEAARPIPRKTLIILCESMN